MEKQIFQMRYVKDLMLDGGERETYYGSIKNNRPVETVEDFIFDVKDFAEFVQIDTDILENEREIIVRFYQPRNFVFFDLAKVQMERLISRCDAIRFRNVESYVYDCIIELCFLKTPDKTVQIE